MQKSIQLFSLLIMFTIHQLSFAQGEANNWYFGENAGMTFNTTPPSALTNGMLNTREGCASISDASGNLLFYTNGVNVYNRNHQLMTNGTGLYGDPSSSQSAIIIPKPGSNSRYYIVTAPAVHLSATNPQITPIVPQNSLCYSEVDMLLNNGLGGVIASSKNTPLFGISSEKLTAVKHSNNVYYWIIGRAFKDSNSFYTFLVDCNGIQTQPIISNVSQLPAWQGYMAVSPDGSKLASASQNNGLEILNINRSTGQISFSSILSSSIKPYGVTFSPNGNLVYCTDVQSGQITQWNLANNSSQIIGTVPLNTPPGALAEPSGAIQLGPDGVIYVCEPFNSFLGTISNPNVVGVGCNYTPSAINLGSGQCRMGLPPFVNSFISPTPHNIIHVNNCLNDFINFSIGDTNTNGTYNWNFGIPNATSAELNPKYKYNQAGSYTITLIRTLDCITDTFSKQITILNNPQSSEHVSICQGGDYIRPSGLIASLAGTYIDTIPSPSGCDSIITTILTLTPSDIDANITSIEPTKCFGSSDGKATISITNGTAPFTYTWSNGQNSSSSSSLSAGNYHIIIKDAKDCKDTVFFEIENAEPFTIATSPSETICPGESTTISAFIQGGGNAPFSILWNNNATSWSQKVISHATSSYTALVTDSEGCTASASVTITSAPAPIADFVISPQGLIYVDQTFTITNISENATAHSLIIDNSTLQFYENKLNYRFDAPGEYCFTLFVTSEDQCQDTTTKCIEIIPEFNFFIPNSFTPNNDKNNDIFRIVARNYYKMSLEIFNRWGEKIIQLDGDQPVTIGWDGYYQNQIAPSGIYVYKLQVLDLNQKEYIQFGHINLIK